MPGIYFASRIDGDVSTDTISFEVSRFEACAELPAGGCESGPYGPDDMGVVEPPARGFKLPLDSTIRVGLSGFECEADQRMATAAELRPLMIDFDRAYDQFLGGPFEQGESADALGRRADRHADGRVLGAGLSAVPATRRPRLAGRRRARRC